MWTLCWCSHSSLFRWIVFSQLLNFLIEYVLFSFPLGFTKKNLRFAFFLYLLLFIRQIYCPSDKLERTIHCFANYKSSCKPCIANNTINCLFICFIQWILFYFVCILRLRYMPRFVFLSNKIDKKSKLFFPSFIVKVLYCFFFFYYS